MIQAAGQSHDKATIWFAEQYIAAVRYVIKKVFCLFNFLNIKFNPIGMKRTVKWQSTKNADQAAAWWPAPLTLIGWCSFAYAGLIMAIIATENGSMHPRA